jgi:bisphosphoglycerate-dependent phosphoglycerate mutase
MSIQKLKYFLNFQFDIVFTSELRRAYLTADIIMEVAFGPDQCKWPKIKKSIKLIERHYGALTGKNKAQMVREYGEEQVNYIVYNSVLFSIKTSFIVLISIS